MKKYYTFQVAFRLFIIISLAIVSGVVYSYGNWWMLAVCLTLLMYTVYSFISYLNSVNRQINFFFECVLNEDFSSEYKLKKRSKILDLLNENLKKVSEKFQNSLLSQVQQEQYFKTLIEHVGTGILTYNKDGFVVDVNGSAKGLFGLDQLTHLKQLNKVDETLMPVFSKIRHKEKKVVSYYSKTKKTNGKILLKAIEFHSAKERVMLVSMQDIDQELDENELDSWLRLIRVLTHEIMNSIAPISSLSETISSLYTKNNKPIDVSEIDNSTIETTVRALDVIHEQGKGLISFVESYRSLTRLPKPNKERVGLQLFIERLILFHQTSNPDINITCKAKKRDLELYADKDLITQVLNNLIKNAIQASSDVNEPRVEIICGVNSKEQIYIEVADNGCGIDSEVIDQIFIPFFTTKEGGSGIGLSLSRQIMRLHKGWLKVHSYKELGTTFKLIFPD